MMAILGTILIGFFAGLIARAIKPGNDAMGWIMTILLGVIGAVIGGWAATTFGLGRILTWVVAILAAIVLLFVYEAMRKKR